MNDLKITIPQISNYLGTGLKIKTWAMNPQFGIAKEIQEIYAIVTYPDERILTIRSQGKTGFRHLSRFKPICYNISDLDKFIPDLGFVPLDEIRKMEMGHCDFVSKERKEIIRLWGFEYWINRIPYGIIQKLFQWHFWPFGDEYFEQGLVIDKMKHWEEVTNEYS